MSNDADRAILQVLSEGVVREFLSDINVSEQEVDTTQFWVNDGRSGECQSLALVDENSISGVKIISLQISGSETNFRLVAAYFSEMS